MSAGAVRACFPAMRPYTVAPCPWVRRCAGAGRGGGEAAAAGAWATAQASGADGGSGGGGGRRSGNMRRCRS